MVKAGETCSEHAGIVARLNNHDEVVGMLRTEIEKMRKTLNWLSIAIAAMALSGLGLDGSEILNAAGKIVGQ
jgi:hypothetical protein